MTEVTSGNNGVLEVVVGYWSRGYDVIDWPEGVKGTDEPWAEKTYDTEEKLRNAFGHGPKNVGIKLGEPSGGLVDVDLDVPEAVAAADTLLPSTGMVSGRPGKPRSHRWYVVPGAETEKWRTRRAEGEKGKMLVELRSTGQQTIVPPSVHPTGEHYQWHAESEPAEVDAEDLRGGCQAVATAALVARRLPEDGRHDFALALAGFMVRPGRLDVETALKTMKAAWDAAGYPPGKSHSEAHQDLENVVRDTAEALDSGEEVSGGPTLDEDHAPGLSRAIAKVWGWGNGGDAEASGKKSQADLLVELAAAAYLFRDPGGEAYATIPVSGHKETHRLNTKGFKNWLRYRFYLSHGKAPGSQAVQDALGTLEGKARFDSPEHEVHVRLAEHDGCVYLDLANEAWEAIEITKDGRRIVTSQDVPVRFRRAGGMRPLPYPVADGDLSGLRRLLNLPEDDEKSWVLIAAWLTQALRPTGPYPVLILQGEQGSAKSTAQRMLRALVDPSTVPLRTAPREERDLMIAATNGWCVAFDNLSGMSPWLSDALCRLATGGGFGTRQLYTDQEEVLFSAMRPAMLNGITDVAGRPDLLDRSLVVELPVIPEERRRTEREIWAEFGAEHPRILGTLLDAVSAALGQLPGVHLEKLPRMAEFAEWAVAAEEGLGLKEGAFMDAYAVARSDAVGQALEGDPVAEAVLAMMADRRQWVGTATELHKRLAAKVEDDVRRSKAWKKTPQHLSAHLRRIAPPLRAVGLEYTPDAGRRGPREPHRKRLRWLDGNGPDRDRAASSTPSTPSTQDWEDATGGAPDTGGVGDGDGGVDDGGTGVEDTGSHAAPPADAAVDDMDAVDGPPHARSGEARMPTEAEVGALVREPPGWLRPTLENYRDEYARPGQVDGAKVVWRVELRTVANNVAAALGLSPNEGERILSLVEKALTDSEYARDAPT